jgi:transcriptional regulator with XRE-family HTH domain
MTLQERRERLGLTRIDLSVQSKVNYQSLWMIERGATVKPRMSTLRKLSRVLGCEVEDLLPKK